ncbi:nuclear transport factor 2 family protein [Hydrogenophaga luteola]|uniref:DUF4440 domain-containing protein n=1 Tax=Hydrogenophaga luteola TaxID=1591122 RepID=A0ABV7W2C3_9BURK
MEPELPLEPGLAPLLAELKTLEDLYHAAYPDATLADFDRLVAPGFWETGATGRRYSRAFARQVLEQRSGRPAPATWQTDQHHLQRVGADVWLLTYRLHQPGRVTRRMTLWRREAGHWQTVYHQGTVVVG